MTEELKTLLKKAFDEGAMYEATLSEACSFTNFIKDLETEQLLMHSVVVTSYCECAKPYREMNDPSNLCRKCLKTLKD